MSVVARDLDWSRLDCRKVDVTSGTLLNLLCAGSKDEISYDEFQSWRLLSTLKLFRSSSRFNL